jgi:hypothetical protein
MSKPNNADTVQALQIAAAKQALQDVTEAVAEMEIEIARLRAELKTSNAERDENELLRSTVTDCRIEIALLRSQRDEARQLACRGLALETYHAAQFIGGRTALTADEIALERGWDCFDKKEETPCSK